MQQGTTILSLPCESSPPRALLTTAAKTCETVQPAGTRSYTRVASRCPAGLSKLKLIAQREGGREGGVNEGSLGGVLSHRGGCGRRGCPGAPTNSMNMRVKPLVLDSGNVERPNWAVIAGVPGSEITRVRSGIAQRYKFWRGRETTLIRSTKTNVSVSTVA